MSRNTSALFLPRICSWEMCWLKCECTRLGFCCNEQHSVRFSGGSTHGNPTKVCQVPAKSQPWQGLGAGWHTPALRVHRALGQCCGASGLKPIRATWTWSWTHECCVHFQHLLCGQGVKIHPVYIEPKMRTMEGQRQLIQPVIVMLRYIWGSSTMLRL